MSVYPSNILHVRPANSAPGFSDKNFGFVFRSFGGRNDGGFGEALLFDTKLAGLVAAVFPLFSKGFERRETYGAVHS